MKTKEIPGILNHLVNEISENSYIQQVESFFRRVIDKITRVFMKSRSKTASEGTPNPNKGSVVTSKAVITDDQDQSNHETASKETQNFNNNLSSAEAVTSEQATETQQREIIRTQEKTLLTATKELFVLQNSNESPLRIEEKQLEIASKNTELKKQIEEIKDPIQKLETEKQILEERKEKLRSASLDIPAIDNPDLDNMYNQMLSEIRKLEEQIKKLDIQISAKKNFRDKKNKQQENNNTEIRKILIQVRDDIADNFNKLCKSESESEKTEIKNSIALLLKEAQKATHKLTPIQRLHAEKQVYNSIIKKLENIIAKEGSINSENWEKGMRVAQQKLKEKIEELDSHIARNTKNDKVTAEAR